MMEETKLKGYRTWALALTPQEFIVRRDEVRTHFIERLKERHGISISTDEYDSLLNMKKHPYRGYFTKSSNKTIGVLKINGCSIWVMYDNQLKLFLTAYPKNIENSPEEMIKCCFSKDVRILASILYKAIQDEIDSAKIDFDNIAEAGRYHFENSKFPKLLIYKYKNEEVSPVRICHLIQKLIKGQHPRATISIIQRDDWTPAHHK